MYKKDKPFVSDMAMKPAEQIKRYLVQLSKDCTEHLAGSSNNDKERHSFAVKTKVLSILLEQHTALDIKTLTFQSYKDLDQEIKKRKAVASL